MDDKPRDGKYTVDTEFLRGNREFSDLPERFRDLVLKSPSASADFKNFFADGGRIVPDPAQALAAYRMEPAREIRINQMQYEFAKTPGGAHLVGRMFSTLAHEIGHDKDRNTPFPPPGTPDTAEAYVEFRSEKEAKTIFNAFPIFADLERSEPSFHRRGERAWDAVGYSVMGLDWPPLYAQWKNGDLDDASVIQEIAKTVADFPYTRRDGLSDHNADARLTQRDLYLRDYQGLLRHHDKPDAAPPAQAPSDPTSALDRLSPNDKALFARIRQDLPVHVGDAHVAQAMLAAKQGHIDRADQVERVGLADERLCIAGTAGSGFARAILDLREPAPAIGDTLRQAESLYQRPGARVATEATGQGPDEPGRDAPRR